MLCENGKIILERRYDSTNAAQLQKDLLACIAENSAVPDAAGKVMLDAKQTDYISSAGLRALLSVKKQGHELKIVNASAEVAEIFEVTGFTRLFEVSKALKVMVRDDSWVEIGHGASSKVFRIGPENLLKVYDKKIPFWKIEREANNVKRAFLNGIQSVIAYNIVAVEGVDYGSFGLIFELFDSQVLSSFLNEHPDLFDEYADKYLALIRSVHAAEADDTFEDIRQLWHSWLDMLAPFLTEEELEKLHVMVAAVPDCHHVVHSDMHVNNVIVSGGELVLIDMADIGFGHPIFDIGPLCFHYHYMDLASREISDNLMVARYEIRDRLWHRLMDDYLADPDPVRHEALVTIYNGFGALRCAILAAKHAQLPMEMKELMIGTMRRELFPRYDEVLALMKQYL